MKKRLLIAALTLALIATWAPVTPAQTSFYFWAQVVDELGKPITSGVTCQVYTAGTDTASTVYSDAALGTLKANPLSGSSTGICNWYASASTAVDLIVWHKRGRARFDAFSVTDHKVIVDKQSANKVVRVAFTNSSGSKTQTGVTIPKGAVLRDVFIELVTAVNKAHIAIGIDAGETGGDDDGFCAGSNSTVGGGATMGRSLSDTGWLACHAVLSTVTASGAWDYYVSGFHSGALISRGSVGSNSYTASSAILPHAGSYIRFPFIGNGTAKTVVYTTSNSNVAGHFYLIFSEYGND